MQDGAGAEEWRPVATSFCHVQGITGIAYVPPISASNLAWEEQPAEALVTLSHRLLTSSLDHTAVLWHGPSLTPLKLISFHGPLTSISFAPVPISVEIAESMASRPLVTHDAVVACEKDLVRVEAINIVHPWYSSAVDRSVTDMDAAAARAIEVPVSPRAMALVAILDRDREPTSSAVTRGNTPVDTNRGGGTSRRGVSEEGWDASVTHHAATAEPLRDKQKAQRSSISELRTTTASRGHLERTLPSAVQPFPKSHRRQDPEESLSLQFPPPSLPRVKPPASPLMRVQKGGGATVSSHKSTPLGPVQYSHISATPLPPPRDPLVNEPSSPGHNPRIKFPKTTDGALRPLTRLSTPSESDPAQLRAHARVHSLLLQAGIEVAREDIPLPAGVSRLPEVWCPLVPSVRRLLLIFWVAIAGPV